MLIGIQSSSKSDTKFLIDALTDTGQFVPSPIRPNFGQFVPVPICPRSICPNFFQNDYIFSSLKMLKNSVCL
jgi:hypothetical protein